ncbi:MAG: uracil-DNA glycosylase [Phycisphaerales bacterium]
MTVARSARTIALSQLAAEIVACTRCPRLRRWCEQVGREKRRAYANDRYWAKPVPGFGDPNAKVLLVGLAPGAHGANRTGRLFTGDRSGDFLYASLHRTGFANQPESIALDDGLRLRGAFISAAGRCAPPANKPTPEELRRCRPYLVRELDLLRPKVLVCLGGLAWNAALAALEDSGEPTPSPRPRFAHAGEARVGAITLLGAYHPSQQNTFTKRLTPPMLDAVMRRARAIAWP